MSLAKLIDPRSIAIVGVSTKNATFQVGGRAVFDHLRRHGYAHRIDLITRQRTEIEGVATVTDLAELPSVPDCLLVSVPADDVCPTIARALELGVRAFVVVTGGFSEAGAEGAVRQRRLVELVAPTGAALLGPNTTGFVNFGGHVAMSSTSRISAGLAPVGDSPGTGLGLHLPVPVVGDLFAAVQDGTWLAYVSVILPMGIFNVVGSLQNIESAEAAGDAYETAPSLAVNGVGTIGAALFGSPFPTTIYIGHPGWKAMGARAGYSVANAVFVTVLALTGTLSAVAWAVPIDAGMAIVLWIGMVITAQAFQAVSPSHAPAVVVGLLPGVGAWGALMAKNGLRAAGMGTPEAPFDAGLIEAFRASDVWIHGAFALEQGFIFTAMILAATTVEIIERRFLRAAAWCAAGAGLSATGLMHGYQFTIGDTALALGPAWPWAAGYGLVALLLVIANWATEPGDSLAA